MEENEVTQPEKRKLNIHERMELRKLKKKEKKEAFRKSKLGQMIDHWFYKTVKVDLSDNQDGSKIREIRKPRITKTVLILLAVAIVIGVSFIPFNYENDLKLNFKSFGDYFKAMFTPNKYRTKDWAGWWKFSWESFAKGISAHGVNSAPFLQIFEINFLGTVLGCILSVPVYYLCANNVNHNPFLREPVKIFNDFLRCIPMFILCVILSFIFGIGNTLPCILAIGLFSMGIMYQMMYEYLETLNMKPFESVRSAGANNLQSVAIGLHPEVKPMFFAYAIYTLEINIRASVVLSYVGLSSTYMNSLQVFIENMWYDYVGAMLVPLFIVVAILQIVSNVLVRHLR